MLQGKVALVTGGARGIGRETALELARRGAIVAVNDLNDEGGEQTVSLVRENGGQASYFRADVGDYAQVDAMVDAIERDLGPVDILINNAGISPKHNGLRKPVAEMDLEEWHAVVNVNLNGAFYCIRRVAPGMRERRWGRIVNISSMAARVYSPIPGAHYCATKAALLGLTRVVAGELAPYGVIVNAITPGRIETEMMKEWGEERNRRLLEGIPVGRFGHPRDVAKVVAFLVSEDASYIVGATIDVNGGRVML